MLEQIESFLAGTGIAKLFGSPEAAIKTLIMYVIVAVLFYLAIVKKFEPLLLLPITFGILLANLPGAGLIHMDFFIHSDGSPIDMARRQRIRSTRLYHNKSKGETYKTQIIGYRGQLKAKNLFEQPATNALLSVKDEFEMLVYKIISDMQL